MKYSALVKVVDSILEIWGREVLIEASGVEIDDKFFEVGLD